MKKNLFVQILFALMTALHSDDVHAQYVPLAEESKYWIYYDFQVRPRPTTGFLITIKGDTVVQNRAYKKVYKYELSGLVKTVAINEPPQFVADLPYKLKDKKLISLIREDLNEKVIYNLPLQQQSCTDPISGIVNPCNDIIFCDTTEHILFDFSLMPDDTLNYCCYAPLHYDWEIKPEKIDSVKYEMHYGKLRKTFYTYGVASFLPNLVAPGQIQASQVKIIEGIGFQHQGIYNYRFGSMVGYCEGNFEMCGIVSSTNEFKLHKSALKVYPNPASDYLKVEANEGIREISLINANSTELFSFRNENLIDLGRIPGGMYICKIKLDNGTLYRGKVIVLNH